MKSTLNLSVLDMVALVLVIVGALNWGFIGLAHFLTEAGNWNLVNYIFGGTAGVEFGIYVLVGLAAVWTVYLAAQSTGYAPAERPMEAERDAEPQD